MVITISRDKNYIYFTSKDRRFHETWGDVFRTDDFILLTNMNEVTNWCNNELHEECLFDVD